MRVTWVLESLRATETVGALGVGSSKSAADKDLVCVTGIVGTELGDALCFVSAETVVYSWFAGPPGLGAPAVSAVCALGLNATRAA